MKSNGKNVGTNSSKGPFPMDLIRTFQQAIEEQLHIEANNLADGNATSYDDYRYRCGMRRGLKRALNIFEDVMQEMKVKDEKF